jgi:hypothetical protein
MRIDHLINGKPKAARDYFETKNPATQEVLAEVASATPQDVDAAVRAAKDAFSAWAAKPATERAQLVHRLGDLIAKNVPELSDAETRDTGRTISQTRKQLVPRAADNFTYFAQMCTRVDGHTYPTDSHLSYTLFHPVGVCALISEAGTWKHKPACAPEGLIARRRVHHAGRDDHPRTGRETGSRRKDTRTVASFFGRLSRDDHRGRLCDPAGMGEAETGAGLCHQGAARSA